MLCYLLPMPSLSFCCCTLFGRHFSHVSVPLSLARSRVRWTVALLVIRTDEYLVTYRGEDSQVG